MKRFVILTTVSLLLAGSLSSCQANAKFEIEQTTEQVSEKSTSEIETTIETTIEQISDSTTAVAQTTEALAQPAQSQGSMTLEDARTRFLENYPSAEIIVAKQEGETFYLEGLGDGQRYKMKFRAYDGTVLLNKAIPDYSGGRGRRRN